MTAAGTDSEPVTRPRVDIYCKIAAIPPAVCIVPTPFVTTPNVDMAAGTNAFATDGPIPTIPQAAIDFVGSSII